MPKSFGRTVDAVFTLAVSLVASACFAEMIVTTHDGRRLTLPVKSSELKGIEFSDGAAPASRYWKLSGVTIDRSRLTRALSEPGGETALSFPCTSDNSCEATQTLNPPAPRFRWTKPPVPGHGLAGGIRAEVVSRVGPRHVRSIWPSHPAPRATGLGDGRRQQASLGSVSPSNGSTRSPAKGDKAVYGFVSAGSRAAGVQYAYDWVDNHPAEPEYVVDRKWASAAVGDGRAGIGELGLHHRGQAARQLGAPAHGQLRPDPRQAEGGTGVGPAADDALGTGQHRADPEMGHHRLVFEGAV